MKCKKQLISHSKIIWFLCKDYKGMLWFRLGYERLSLYSNSSRYELSLKISRKRYKLRTCRFANSGIAGGTYIVYLCTL